MFTKRTNPIECTLIVLLLAGASTLAEGFDLSWHTIDDGGKMFTSGGDFELSGAIGQCDAGVLTGGDFELTGGFWFGIVPGDCDQDGDVDLGDFADFAACLQGPGGGLGLDCGCFDFDASGDVDLRDFAAFQAAFTG